MTNSIPHAEVIVAQANIIEVNTIAMEEILPGCAPNAKLMPKQLQLSQRTDGQVSEMDCSAECGLEGSN